MQSLSDLFTDEDDITPFFGASVRRDTGDERINKKDAFLWQESDHSSFDFLNLNNSVADLAVEVADFGKTTMTPSVETNDDKQMIPNDRQPKYVRSHRQNIPNNAKVEAFVASKEKLSTIACGKSRVISSANDCSESESESSFYTPKKQIRGIVRETSMSILSPGNRSDRNLEKNGSQFVSPLSRRKSHRMDRGAALNESWHTTVSPVSSLDDSSHTEPVLVAPSFPIYRPELMESCPLVSGQSNKMRVRTSLRRTDAAPKRPNRSRSPSPISRVEQKYDDKTRVRVSIRRPEQASSNSRW